MKKEERYFLDIDIFFDVKTKEEAEEVSRAIIAGISDKFKILRNAEKLNESKHITMNAHLHTFPIVSW